MILVERNSTGTGSGFLVRFIKMTSLIPQRSSERKPSGHLNTKLSMWIKIILKILII